MKNLNEIKNYKKGDTVKFWKSAGGNFRKQLTGIITKITVLNEGTHLELKYADIKYYNQYGDSYYSKMRHFAELITVD